jgi:hypothetical protein
MGVGIGMGVGLGSWDGETDHFFTRKK